MNEEWRDVVGYEGLYEVSNVGRIRSVTRLVQYKDGRKPRLFQSLMKALIKHDKSDHLMVSLYKNRKGKLRFVHQLVLEAFVGPRPEGAQSCHFPDRDPTNNRVENLMWGTSKENHRHSIIHGTHGRKPHYLNKGSNNGMAKLDEKRVVKIRKLYERGWTQKNLGIRYGVQQSLISQITRRVIWQHV